MINPVSSLHSAQASQQTQAAVPSKAQSQNNLPQDTVSLKSTAPKSTGDVDHDGDSK
jgi:hypothetical protein